MRLHNYYRNRGKKTRKSSIEILSVKEGDIVIQKMPTDRDGNPAWTFEVAQAYHKALKSILPQGVKVYTNYADLSVMRIED